MAAVGIDQPVSEEGPMLTGAKLVPNMGRTPRPVRSVHIHHASNRVEQDRLP